MDAAQRELWVRVETLWALAAARDRQGIRAALHPDYQGWDMSSPLPHDREAAVRSATGDAPQLLDYSLEPLGVRLFEGRTGVVHYRYRADVQDGAGAAREVTGRWTEVYVRHGLNWLLAAVSGRPGPG